MALYSRPRNTRLLVVSLVMLSLITITIDYRGGDSGPLELAGKGTLSVVGAMQGAVRKVVHPVSAFFSGLAHIGSLKDENARLQEEVRKLEAERAQTITLQRQNEQFRKLLDLQNALSLKGVSASVIGESIGNFEWSITIDRGSTSGIRRDMAVISGDGLVGHVDEVAPNASKVLLVIDPRSSVAGRLAGSGETGLVVGQTDKNDLRMDLVNPQTEVAPDEEVLTSGYQGGLYPPGIPIGVTSHVFTNPGSLTKTISIRPVVDFSALEFVIVVTGRSPS